jgi:predicted O-methyltransferase YrrM
MEHFWCRINSKMLNCTGPMFTFWELYREAVAACREGGTVIEIGTWVGQSLACLAVEAINANKHIKIIGVDIFAGSIHDGKGKGGVVQISTLAENLAPIWDDIRIIKAPSVEAADMCHNADFVFIDGDHSYASVCADLAAWYPVVRNGGILAGHDIHYPEVRRAVDEFAKSIGTTAEIYVNETSQPGYDFCWMIRK